MKDVDEYIKDYLKTNNIERNNENFVALYMAWGNACFKQCENLEYENEKLKAENAALRERLNITKMALEYACLETLQSNEQYLEELKEKVNKYIKQSEDVVYGQKNGVTFRFAEARLAELKGEEK